IQVHDYSDRAVETFKTLGLDCLFVVGGEGTLEIGYLFYKKGIPVVGIPKTIDNDLEKTDYTFGYQTAVQVACDAMDRLHTTGRSHHRVMILEVMGRNAGWIALEAGIAGGAHIILIPEIEYRIENVIKKIQLRKEGGSPFSIIIVAEGAREKGKETVKAQAAEDRLQGVEKLGGIGFYLAKQIEKQIDLEVRTTVLGHIQRGGSPNSFDRVLGTRLGSFAVDAAADGKFGTMVSLRTPDVSLVRLKDLAGKVRTVSMDSQLIRCAESIGINLGREAM
ncbi:MAG: ATP-dependent 6-phosphofructokinase, partial [Desulfobacterales bacterium]|nr:ATP-dependent 6-phosphofructokinase [Desulfobacterales bacterium]